MVLEACDALFRAVVLLGLALAPYAAPLDVRPSASMGAAWLRLAAAAAVTVVVIAAVRWSARRAPAAALLLVIAWLTLVTCAALFSGSRGSGENGPVVKALPLALPLVWLTLAAFVNGALARLRRRATLRGAATLMVLLAAGLSAGGGYARVASPRARAEAGHRANPGNEPAAVAYGAALARERRGAEATAVLRACARARPSACRCAVAAAEAALEAAAHAEALATLDGAAPACKAREPAGLRAEALAGLGVADAALREADRALIEDPDDKHALFAKARGLSLTGNATLARRYATLAIARGRGAQARLLLGLLLYQAGELDAAEVEFRAVLDAEPDHAGAVYDLALVAHRLGRYRDAREGYLRALKLDPASADARYNLVMLTHAGGADQEATHHLEELRKAAPQDARIDELTRLLEIPP